MKTEAIYALQKTLQQLPEELHVEAHVDHYFADGAYARLCNVKAGCTVIGKKHKTNHFLLLLEGTAQISSKYGSAVFTAPYMFLTMPGDKRAVSAITDSKFMTFHVTNLTDLAEIEKHLIDSEDTL